jgi:predicted DCC family thiol-disulfide oxidoreductase YuxK
MLIPRDLDILYKNSTIMLKDSYPILFQLLSSSFGAHILVIFLLLLSLFFTLGIARRFSAVIILIFWIALEGPQAFFSDLGMPKVSFLLVASLFIPLGEPLRVKKSRINKIWSMPPLIISCLWFLLIVSLGLDALNKAFDPTWLQNAWYKQLWSWIILVLELLFISLSFFKYTQLGAWIIAIILSILLANFALFLFLLFIFDDNFLKTEEYKEQAIVFFDGICGLCNSFIEFLFIEDRHNILLFSTLQGESAKELNINNNLESIVLYDNKQLFYKSDAIIRILSSIGGIWRLAIIARLLPRGLRDGLYYLIATNRYSWFGKKESCPIPTKEEQARFLP